MKRFGILLVVAMLGLVLACGSKEEEKAKKGTPSAQSEKVAPKAPSATPTPTAPKPEHPK